MEKRDAQKDLELCSRATKGPWTSFSEHSDGTPNYVWAEPISVVLADNVLSTNDNVFIAKSREALPYWIKRAAEAEKLLSETNQLLDRITDEWRGEGSTHELIDTGGKLWCKNLNFLEKHRIE